MDMLRRTLGLLGAIVGRLVRGALAAALLAVLLVAVPWGLVHYIGWPLPDHLPTTATYRDIWLHTNYDVLFVLRALAVLLWLFWARFALAVAVEFIAITTHVIRYGRRPKLPTGPVQITAAILAGALISLLCLDLIRGLARPATTTAGAAPRAGVAALAPAHPGATTSPTGTTNGARPPVFQPRVQLLTATALGRAPTATTITYTASAAQTVTEPDWVAQARAAGHPIYVVQPGDNLTTIAVEQLGDGQRWREIYVLNRGKPQPTGYTLSNPDEIDKCWFLALPKPAAAEPEPASASTSPASTSEHHQDPAGTPNPAAGPDPEAASPNPSNTASPVVAPSPSLGPAAGAPDDGLATAPVADSSSAGTAAPSPSATSAEAAPATARPAGVDLPSGAWLSAGLAAVLAGLASAVRLHRRRRTRPGRPTPRLAPARPLPAALRLAAAVADRDSGAGLHTLPTPRPPAIDSTGGEAHAGHAEIGLCELAERGAALTGPGAPDVARAVIASALSASPLYDFDDRAEILIPAELLADLAPAWTPTAVARLHVAADTAAALATLEAEVVYRRGILDMLGAESHAALRAVDDFNEPLALYVLVVRADAEYLPRLAAILDQAAAVRLGVLLVGDADPIPGLEIARGGAVTAVRGPVPVTAGARLSTLTGADLAEILAVLPEAAYTPSAEPEPDPGNPTSVEEAGEPAIVEVAVRTGAAVVQAGVLGVPQFTVTGQSIAGVRSIAKLVVAYLAAHPDGATLAEMAAPLLPNTERKAAKASLRTAINGLRGLLRQAAGLPEEQFICCDDNLRYRIDPQLVDVDTWQVQAALAIAATGDDDTTQLAALRQAAALYRGEYTAGIDDFGSAWLLAQRERYHRQAVDVLARIAELEEPDRPDAALRALDTAIDLDPYNEALYQHIIRIQGRCARPDAVRRTLTLLENRMFELDAEISDATRRLVHRQSATARAVYAGAENADPDR